MLKLLAHFFTPRKSNNYRARLLHKSSLLVIALLFLGLNFLVKIPAHSRSGQVLGYAASISPSEVIRLTNEKRAQNGLPALTENAVLSRAALAKGTDMFNKDYWAHVAPDGTTPWSFFASFGYSYKYAGENLARDFTNPSSAVDAWMASSSHRANILSTKYKEIGVAVLDGNLGGADTTLIVQFFGTKPGAVAAAVVPLAEASEIKPKPTVVPTSKPVATPNATPVPVVATPLVSPIAVSLVPQETVAVQKSGGLGILGLNSFSITKIVSLSILGVLLITLVVDSFIVRKHGVVRVGGRVLAHLSFLGMLLALILVYAGGRIL